MVPITPTAGAFYVPSAAPSPQHGRQSGTPETPPQEAPPPAGAAASLSGTNFAGATFDHAMFQEIATEAADFSGADFIRVLSMGATGLMGGCRRRLGQRLVPGRGRGAA